jgi:tetratricopeptide (TPR) repeat protein
MRKLQNKIVIIIFLFIISSCGSTAKNLVNANKVVNPGSATDIQKQVSPRLIYYYSVAMLNIYNKNYHNAEHFLLKALELDENSYFLNYKIANFYLHFGKVEKAIHYCEKALIIKPDYEKAHEFLASIYAATNNITGAINEYKTLLKYKPDNAVFMLNYGLFLLKAEKFQEAKIIFKKIIKNKDLKYKIMGYYYLGKVYAKIKLYNEAINYFKKTINLKPDFSRAYYDIALVYELQGNTKKAYNYYLKILKIDPDNILAREKVVRFLVKENNLKEALNHLKRLKELEGDNIDINIKLALIYMEIKEYKEAIKILQKFKDFPKAQYYLISCYLKINKPKNALKIFRNINQESSYFLESGILIVNFFIENHEFSKALNNYLELLHNLKTKNLRIYRFGLYLFDKAKDYKRGIEFINEAIKDFPNTSEFYFYQGFFYDKLEQPLKKVIKSMKKAIEVNPKNADALNYLGYTYAIKNIHLQEAEKLIKQALLIHPDSPSIIDSLGWVYFKQGKIELALKNLKKAYELNNGKEPEIIYHCGMVYLKMGNKKLAKKFLLESLKIVKDKKLKNKIKKALEEIND